MRELLFNLYKIKLLKRILQSIVKKIYKFFIKSYVIINHNNFKLKLNLNNPIDREIFFTKKYEESNILFLQKLLKENNIEYFFDIGAHMGFYSINMASIFPDLLISSFEPIEGNYNQLKLNVEINDFVSKIKIYKKVLSNESKEIKMWVPKKERTGGFSVYNENDIELKKYESGKISFEYSSSEKLDNICKIKNKKIALKIDVKRHEKFVILGANEILTKNDVLLQIEIFDQMKVEVAEMLKKLNFNFIQSNGNDYFYSNLKILN